MQFKVSSLDQINYMCSYSKTAAMSKLHSNGILFLLTPVILNPPKHLKLH